MDTISRCLLTFLLNALWQIPAVAAVAALACRRMRHGPASHRHAIWVTALATALLLPAASIRARSPAPTPHYDSVALSSANRPASTARKIAAGTPATAPLPGADRTILLAESTATLLLVAYSLFLLFQLARLALAVRRTMQIRRAAHAAAIPPALADVWRRCRQCFDVTKAELLFSAEVSGPVTAGRAIILPESLLDEPSADVLTTAIGHEMAHIARRDFAGKLLLEILYLPVSFQPAAWLIRRGVERTRELACDELVTERLLEPGAYARSIVTIATGMAALPQPGCTLGVFDGDILEERIRRLLDGPIADRKRARLFLLAGLSAVAICALAASTVALKAHAQSRADTLIQQGNDAYHRGDFPTAAAQFEAAAHVEPANLNAGLSLSRALVQTIGPPPWKPESPLVARVHRLYLDVLAIDPRNLQAHQGLRELAIATRQYDEAHAWAVKAIADDPSDATNYYAAAFTDWCPSYIDYLAARQAAGMTTEDPGIIPDAGARLGLRIRRMAQLEDGVSMAQTALQIAPDYSQAMAYTNLLYRIEAGIADSNAQYDDLIAQANKWAAKAQAAQRRSPRMDGQTAPPPPPPPPPPRR